MLTEQEKEQMTGVGKIILPTGEIALVDLEDLPLASQYNWHRKLGPSGNIYVKDSARNRKPRSMYLARIIMKTPHGMQCDHQHGDGLDNRKSMLRNATPSSNQRGFRRKPVGCSSIFRGVSIIRNNKMWIAKAATRVGGILNEVRCGPFPTEREAAIAYNYLAASLGFRKEAFNNIST